MPQQDFAIVLGLPGTGEGGGSPGLRIGHDVAAMRAWLLDPAGGAVPPERLRCIAPPAGPALARPGARSLLLQFEQVLNELEAQARQNLAAGRGPRLGRRLYLYMSGRACLPGRGRPTSAGRPGVPLLASAWLAWAQRSGLFRDVVLWLDCDTTDPAVLPRRDSLPAAAGAVPPGAGFAALAARSPLVPPVVQAAGRPQGAFTQALLAGLRGAAADASGRVTGRGLADWLRHAQAALLPGEAPAGVAAEPEIAQADAGLLLAEAVTPPHYPVRLEFPPEAWGQPARLWHGTPPRLDPGLGLARARVDLALPPGLYLVEVPGAGLRQGFEVLGPTRVAVASAGPAVRAEQTGALLALDARATESIAPIAVTDSRFALVRRGIGAVQTRLPFGLYKLRCRQGRQLHGQVLLLDQDQPTLALAASPPEPLPQLPPLPATAGADALLRLTGLPQQGLSVVDAHGLTVLDLAYDGSPTSAADGMVSAALALPPGSYFLRQRLGPSQAGTAPCAEQSLLLPPGWALEVRVPPRPTPGRAATVSLLLRRPGRPGSPAQDRLVETLGIALADRRRILTPALEQALTQAVVDPLAGILTGHLLLAEHEHDPAHDLAPLDGLVRQLQALLGADHPDVHALALRCPDHRLRPTGPVTALPLYYRSWRLLVAASHESRGLLPRRLWERALARTVQAPFLAWSMDRAQRSAVQLELAEATWGGAPQPLARQRIGNVISLSRPVPVKSGRAIARHRARLLDVPLSALDLLADVYQDSASA